MKEYNIGKNDAGQRLDRFVSKTVPLLPSSLLQKYIRLKRIKVNGKGSKRDEKLSAGDMVQMYINDEFFERPTEENAYLKITEPKLDIVYEDENIILLNKPVGMLCHSDGGFSYNTLIAELQAYLYAKREWRPREENSFAPALCNRIDRNTCGIVIAAKNAETLRIMNEKIKEHDLSKLYLAVTHGIPKPKSGELKGYLFKDAVKNQVYVKKSPEPGAKLSVTEYKTLLSKNGLSLVECKLLTGRTHQIRVQFKSIGCPLLGDGKYGSERLDKGYGQKGQALCSYKLIFDFQKDAGMLNYLKNKEFCISKIDFVDRYFPEFYSR